MSRGCRISLPPLVRPAWCSSDRPILRDGIRFLLADESTSSGASTSIPSRCRTLPTLCPNLWSSVKDNTLVGHELLQDDAAAGSDDGAADADWRPDRGQARRSNLFLHRAGDELFHH